MWERQAPLVAFCQKNDIVVEAYSVLMCVAPHLRAKNNELNQVLCSPLTPQPGGPVDAPVNSIASRLKVAPEQVLLAWAKAKGAVVVTSSTKKDRLERYLDAGDIGT